MESVNKFKILDIDPYLKPFESDIALRMDNLKRMLKKVAGEGTLSEFANGHNYFGFHRTENGCVFREWAPNARKMALVGDFNGWDRNSHIMKRAENGIFELFLEYDAAELHGSKVRLIIWTDYEVLERIPSYCLRVVQDPVTRQFDGQIILPECPYKWTADDMNFKINGDEPLMIYECHIGMCMEYYGVATYNDFTNYVLPRVRDLGYNAIQIMAVMEHPYYGSFGYQVSNFFAASSRFGEPDDLKRLISAAHAMGIAVFLDLVHSHAVGNEVEGLSRFDGTSYQYFHEGARGKHSAWGTRLFNYNKPEVIHFLLSNLKFWLTEYRFDGFRFDGVTSMLYHDHGLGGVFDSYDKYFSLNTDTESMTYLQLAAMLCKEVNENCVLIAEDMSGMPGMCLPVEWGGVGFDYRLGMGMPDFYMNTLKKRSDEDWSMSALWYELNQRRPGEKVIGYSESHDQALVGDKTIMFWLADKEMYWHMNKGSRSDIIERAISLHKMISLITCVCAGEGYLNFMGNEFGHPEWIDFPREGNNNSYHYARRQWSLCDDENLRYHYLRDFDRDMISFVRDNRLLFCRPSSSIVDDVGKVIIFDKGGFTFLFNFHPQNDFDAYLDVEKNEGFQLDFFTNNIVYGGYIDENRSVITPHGGKCHIRVDRRSAVVCHRVMR